MSQQLTELGRRVLGHLPAWAADEKAHVAMEGGPEISIRSYNLADFTVRLAEDRTVSPSLSEIECEQSLNALVDAGLAARNKAGEWRMTKAGFELLTGAENKPDQQPGTVLVETHPAVMQSDSKGA